MAGGYTGKILRVDLTKKAVSTIDTAKYEEYGGGHGMGSAIFFDLVKDKTIAAYDPANVITIMTSPLSGTIAPAVAGRTEVQGIGSQGYPIEWFTRSNFGGRFSGQLKFAGWDGIVLEGKADKPVWIDIRNDKVEIRDADGIWGLDAVESQEEIWRRVQSDVGDWNEIGGTRDAGRPTQRPAVVTIGPVGETLSRTAALIHDSGNGAGQGGFGAVFGSKNLKAISVVGTGSVKLADAKALMDARMWLAPWTAWGHHDDTYKPAQPKKGMPMAAGPGSATLVYAPKQEAGPQGCLGCVKSCRARFKSGKSNGSSCIDLAYYMPRSEERRVGKEC